MKKKIIRRILLIISLVIFSGNVFANHYDFEVDGIYYRITSEENNEVCVTYPYQIDDLGYVDDMYVYEGECNIPASVTHEKRSFSVTSIDNQAFCRQGNLTSITIPSTVTSIGNYAFMSCAGLKSIVIPNSVSSIGDWAFCYCNNLYEIILPNQIKAIPDHVFCYCTQLTEIVIPNSVVRIEAGAFCQCWKLKKVNIPSGVNYIGTIAFTGCESLQTITIPPLAYLGNKILNECKSLENVYCEIADELKITSIYEGAFDEMSSTPILHVPQGTKEIYEKTSKWSNYFSSIIDDLDNPYTHQLSISATGNGSVTYSEETIRNSTKTFTINDGSTITLYISPDSGYRIKSLKLNGEILTGTILTIPFIHEDNKIEVEFEVIPDTPSLTTYTLSITASGNGSASYSGDVIRGTTKSYSVNDGTNVTVNFNPDSGYRIKTLKVNGSSVSATNSYSLTINSDTTIEVEFEEIPDTPSVTSYTLSITASGNGSANYGGESIRGTSRSYTLNEGSSVSISFTPDEGYQIENVKVNGSNIGKETSYSTTLNANTTIEVVFEAIPVTTYTLTVTASGSGIATFNGTEVRDGSQSFTVNEGSDAVVSFSPDKGYMVEEVKVDGNEVEFSESYTISDITSDKTIEVSFAELDRNFSIDGASYHIESFDDNTVTLTEVQKTIVLEVADKIDFGAQEWSVIGISENALDKCDDLAAIVWNLQIPFIAKVSNPNLLLYVKDEAYAPAGIRNVVVNGFAKTITLTDAQSGNNFYCPSTFTTQSIIYTHNYSMKTGLNESKGWETIALPFDVQQISHSSRGDIVPFAKWTSEDATKPFWLFELTGYGFIEVDGIKANTPYIISMPNNEIYPSDYQLSGRVTFSALNAEVKKSDDIQTSSFSNRSFVPNFTCQEGDAGLYALNIRNDYEAYSGGENEGSKFILNLRKIHPFEAYMTSTSNARAFDIFDDMKTAIRGVEYIGISQKQVKVYDLSGKLLKVGASLDAIKQELPAGVYIVNNQKIMVK